MWKRGVLFRVFRTCSRPFGRELFCGRLHPAHAASASGFCRFRVRLLQLLQPRHGRDAERREVAVLVAVVTRHGDHRRVVRRELEFGQERAPAAPAALFDDPVAQS
nr:MAG TPA: hypothetical protein [Caudoviricetes sp.]